MTGASTAEVNVRRERYGTTSGGNSEELPRQGEASTRSPLLVGPVPAAADAVRADGGVGLHRRFPRTSAAVAELAELALEFVELFFRRVLEVGEDVACLGAADELVELEVDGLGVPV